MGMDETKLYGTFSHAFVHCIMAKLACLTIYSETSQEAFVFLGGGDGAMALKTAYPKIVTLQIFATSFWKHG